MYVPDDRVNLCRPFADLMSGWQAFTKASPCCHFWSAAQLNGCGTDFLTQNPSIFNILNVCVADGHFVIKWHQWSKLVHMGNHSDRNIKQYAAMFIFSFTSTSVCLTDEIMAAVLTALSMSVGAERQTWWIKVIKYCLWILSCLTYSDRFRQTLVHFACLVWFFLSIELWCFDQIAGLWPLEKVGLCPVNW